MTRSSNPILDANSNNRNQKLPLDLFEHPLQIPCSSSTTDAIGWNLGIDQMLRIPELTWGILERKFLMPVFCNEHTAEFIHIYELTRKTDILHVTNLRFAINRLLWRHLQNQRCHTKKSKTLDGPLRNPQQTPGQISMRFAYILGKNPTFPGKNPK